jgi:prefoldin beta subunit
MENSEELQELQFLEQNLSSILMQKRAIDMEIAELESSIEEVKKTKDGVFKLIGNIMIKTDKESVERDLKERILKIKSKAKTYDLQEKNVSNRIKEIREKILKDKKKK